MVGSITTSWPHSLVEIKAKPLAVLAVQGTGFGEVSGGFRIFAQDAVSYNTVDVGTGLFTGLFDLNRCLS